MTRVFELRLPDPERRRAAGLAGRWQDLLYVPGPEFSSPVEPGLYRSSFVIIPGDGRAVRVSSFVVPAFGVDLCRLRLEPLVSVRRDNLGSFFEPERRGTIYAMSPDRKNAAARAPNRRGWSYEGSTLRPRLDTVTRMTLIRERVTGGSESGAFSWVADRGLVVTGADGQESLLLAAPEGEEHAVFLPSAGFYRALFDRAVPERPGASVKDLLGYGDSTEPLEIQLETEAL